MAMDRGFKNLKSVSPLKHRVDFDVEPSPSRVVMLETLRQSSPYRSRSKGRQTGATLPLSMQKNDLSNYQDQNSIVMQKSPNRNNVLRSSV
jgi:hypothetical protein